MILFFLFQIVTADFIKNFPNKSTFLISPINDTHIEIRSNVTIGTYLGIGFSPTMHDSDMIIF